MREQINAVGERLVDALIDRAKENGINCFYFSINNVPGVDMQFVINSIFGEEEKNRQLAAVFNVRGEKEFEHCVDSMIASIESKMSVIH